MKDKFILLVEDNSDDEDLTILAFKKSRIRNEVIVVRDGQEALDFLFCEGVYAKRDPTVHPQVILLHLKLPKVDGLEVLKRLRAHSRTKNLPVVVLTSSKMDSDLIASYNLGTNSYVQKPVNFDEFAEAVQQLGLYWMVLNQMPSISP